MSNLTEEETLKMTVADLKTECQERGLKVSGKKSLLQQRVIDHLRGQSKPEDLSRRGGGDGLKRSSSNVEGSPAAKKRKTGRVFIQGVPQADLDACVPTEVKRITLGYVRAMHKMVDQDWHDGTEDQALHLMEYFKVIREPCQAVYNILEVPNLSPEGIDHCHQVLVTIADSWENMLSIPMRGGISDAQEDFESLPLGDTTVDTVPELLRLSWKNLLRKASSTPSVPDNTIFRYIKDYSSFCQNPDVDDDDDDDEENKTPEEGKKRLRELFERKSEWENLVNIKKTYTRKRVLDRRFDGPKSRRTRDYDSDDFN